MRHEFFKVQFCRIAHCFKTSPSHGKSHAQETRRYYAALLDFAGFLVLPVSFSNAICNALTPRYYAQGDFQIRNSRL